MKNFLLLAFFGHGDDRLFQWESSHIMAYEGSFRLSGLILQVLAYRMPILLLVIIQHTGHEFYSHLYSCTEEYA
jgi:hypothetical protein